MRIWLGLAAFLMLGAAQAGEIDLPGFSLQLPPAPWEQLKDPGPITAHTIEYDVVYYYPLSILTRNTLYVEIATHLDDKAPLDRDAALAAIRKVMEQDVATDDGRNKIVSSDITTVVQDGRSCLRWHYAQNDFGVKGYEGLPSPMVVDQLRCPHPQLPGYTITITIGTRAQPGVALLPADSSAAQIQKSLRFRMMGEPT